MTLNQMRDLIAVVNHGGFRAAGRALGVSQAALTKSILKFERECGFSLLERHVGGIALTREGDEMYRYANGIVFEADRVEAWLKNRGAARSESLAVGSSIEPLMRFLPVVLADYRRLRPDVTLRLTQGVLCELVAGVRERRLEFAITRLPTDFSETDIDVDVLCRADSIVVARAGHPCAHCTDIEDLVSQDWVILGDKNLLGVSDNSIHDLFERRNLASPRISTVTDSLFAAVTEIVSSGALARLPRAVLTHPLSNNLLVEFPLSIKQREYDIAIIRKSTQNLGREARTLAAMLKSFTRIGKVAQYRQSEQQERLAAVL